MCFLDFATRKYIVESWILDMNVAEIRLCELLGTYSVRKIEWIHFRMKWA